MSLRMQMHPTDSTCGGCLNMSSITKRDSASAAPAVRLRYVTLDAWRGVACLGVLVFHSFGGLGAQPVSMILAPLRATAAYGWFGVDLFFVISGYCIADKLHGMLGAGQSAGRFWANRALRIFPTYWFALAFTLLIGIIAFPFNGVAWSDVFPVGLKGWAADLFLLHPYLGAKSSVLVSWSLVYELGFYALMGVILLPHAGTRWLPAYFGAGMALCFVPLLVALPKWALVLGLWPDFFLGSAVYTTLYARANGVRWAATAAALVIVLIGALALAGIAIMPLAGYMGGRRGATAAFAALLVLLHPLDRRLAAFRPVRWLGAAGSISYSLYLVHVPVLGRILNLGQRVIPTGSLSFVVLWSTAISAALLVGFLFNRWIEHPMESLRRTHVETRRAT